MKKIEFYMGRYNQHQVSVKFSKKKLLDIKERIKFVCDLSPRLNEKEFQFLIDIARLVVAARRSLSYTYAIRYYFTDAKKQAFFDF